MLRNATDNARIRVHPRLLLSAAVFKFTLKPQFAGTPPRTDQVLPRQRIGRAEEVEAAPTDLSS